MKHEWQQPGEPPVSRILVPFCRVCGVVRRRDGKNRPCKGPTRLRPMEGEVAEQLLGDAARLGVPIVMDAIADVVLAYRPKARSGPAVQRKRRRTILQKQKNA